MSELETIEFYKEQVKEYMDAEGRFPDTILGDEIWPLSYCYKHWIDDALWWSFAE